MLCLVTDLRCDPGGQASSLTKSFCGSQPENELQTPPACGVRRSRRQIPEIGTGRTSQPERLEGGSGGGVQESVVPALWDHQPDPRYC